ncbi:hypothetical protein [Psychromonas aquimarina]|uniref:hypothetical protein n=1 Tax=Psychromonas aquimarina TaxID=444919 RepID=UPI00040B8D63|nr:hypothetical protein [Psychromonas aquimarina]
MFNTNPISQGEAERVQQVTKDRICKEIKVSECGCHVLEEETPLAAKMDDLAKIIEGRTLQELKDLEAKADEFDEKLEYEAYGNLIDIVHAVRNE